MPYPTCTISSSEGMRVGIIGAGHAGRGLAAYLSLRGMDISLYNRTRSRIEAILKSGWIDAEGIVDGRAYLSEVSDDIASIVRGRDVLVVTTPANVHEHLARIMAPYLEAGQIILLMPGRTGGALEFYRGLQCMGCEEELLLAEASSYSLVSRIRDATSVYLSGIKNGVKVSAFPSSRNPDLFRKLGHLPLQLVEAKNVLETSFENMGAMLHPTPTLLSSGLLESKHGGYKHYLEAISQSVGEMIEKMDAERVQVAESYVSSPVSIIEWFRSVYGVEGDSLWECIQNVEAYRTIGSPTSLEHRYVLEDVPTGLVPISYLGKLAGIETPTIDSIIDLATRLYNVSFLTTGRTLSKLGLEGLTPCEIVRHVENNYSCRGEKKPSNGGESDGRNEKEENHVSCDW